MLPLVNIRHIIKNNTLCRIHMGRLFLVVALLLSINFLSAQIITLQDQLKVELEKNGLEYNEVRDALFLRGYDIENMTSITPSQQEDIRDVIELLIDQKRREELLDQKLETIQDTTSTDTSEIDNVLDETEDIDEFTAQEGLQVFGHNLFSEGQFAPYEPSEDLVAPADYRLGIGDRVVVSIFGRSSQLEQEYLVDESGAISINNGRARVSISDLNINQASRKVLASFQRFMQISSDEFSMKVRGSKTVQVQVVGEVNSPGSYLISAFNNPFSAVAAADGPKIDGSLRNVKVIRANGSTHIFDLYEWLTSPVRQKTFYLENGDVIHVPISAFRVEMIGEIRRPMYYDGKDGEGIKDIIEYAGGLNSNAYLNNFQLIRLDGISRNVLDIRYLDLLRTRSDFKMKDGDQVTISAIAEEIENYVRISGEVRNEGDYELRQGMKVYDLIQKAKLKESSRTDLVYIMRRSDNELMEIKAINLQEILDSPSTSENMLLKAKDEIVVYKKARFVDEEYVVVAGAVREPDTLLHDASGSLRITDYINMAGGLQKDAALFAHIHRIDPLNPNIKEFKRVDLERAFDDPNAVDNLVLQAYDSVHVYSLTNFVERKSITVSGAVNNPEEFEYGNGMTLADAIILAGGFKLSSATNEIEVSRVIIEENKPTTIQLQTVSSVRDINALAKTKDDIELLPFDNIFVREVPEFELQRVITVEGEVTLPGQYSLIKDNETVYDIIHRAGGATEEAFLAGAQLYRQQDSLGFIVMRLDEVMSNPRSKYNYNLKNGDIISVPLRKDYVTIRGATRAAEAVDKDILGPNNEISVPYHPGKNAKFYIDYYAGGFAPKADKKKVFVRHPNGEVRQLEKRFLAPMKFPEVREGSVITVGYQEYNLVTGEEKDDVDWNKVLTNSVGQASTILTLILLLQRLE